MRNKLNDRLLRNIFFLTAAALTAVMLLTARVITAYAAEIENLDYELKFLLDSEQVLDEDHLLKEEWKTEFGFTDDPRPIEVMYLETMERDFQKEGWNNRLRYKSGAKNTERVYKKRYSVLNNDIEKAVEEAKKDGFAISDSSNKNGKAEIDWGYEEMNLSFSLEVKIKGHKGLASITVDEARDFLKEAMPDIETDWKEIGWGTAALQKAEMAGPLTIQRYKGNFKGRETMLEIWPIREKDGDIYVVELSFKATAFSDAKAGRDEFTEWLDEKKILLHEDSLKTKRILDAWLIPVEPDHVHSLELVAAEEAACTKPGNIAYYVCSACGQWFEDATALKQITDKNTVMIPALGHKWDKGTVTKEASYLEEGILTYTCLRDHTHIKTEAIPKKERRSSGSSGRSGRSERTGSSAGSVWTQDAAGWHYHEKGQTVYSAWRLLSYNGLNYWYYFDEAGVMKTGWLDWDGNRYYLCPASDGWMGRLLTGWQQIGGRWYYFETEPGKNQGRMYRSERTPDGFYVGADGGWEESAAVTGS